MKKLIIILLMTFGSAHAVTVQEGEMLEAQLAKWELHCRFDANMAKKYIKEGENHRSYVLPRWSFVYHRCHSKWWELKSKPITVEDYELINEFFGERIAP